MDIKPIETEYNGYRFRSRLEARWAVFFDAFGIKYQYETEGFEVNGWRYLPDFYLPEYEVYVEVKPSAEKLMEEAEKLAWMVDFNGPCAKGLLILGQIPNPEKISYDVIPAFSLAKWNGEGIVGEDVFFVDGTLFIREAPYCYASAPDFPNITDLVSEDLTVYEGLLREYDGYLWRIVPRLGQMKHAYRKARQARFEHGETPA